ncbi:hypothetical protein AAY473_016678 [Plecturocebus cupreus]
MEKRKEGEEGRGKREGRREVGEEQEAGLTLLPRLECSGTIIVHYTLELLGSSKNAVADHGSLQLRPPGLKGSSCFSLRLGPQVHTTTPIFLFLVETEYLYVAQVSLKLLASSDLPALTSQKCDPRSVKCIFQS